MSIHLTTVATIPRILPIVAASLTVALLTLTACKGPPARLSFGKSDTVVVNSLAPAQLSVQVLDGRGRDLPSRVVRYRWVSGDPVRLSTDGRITCAQRGDAELRATLGELSTRLFLLCRPIRGVDVSLNGQLVVGGPPQELVLVARGVDNQPVTLIAGHATVRDSEVVSMRGLRVFPKAQGETTVDVELGDCVRSLDVTVDQRVDSAGTLQPYQQFVVSPLRLVPGEIKSWRITPGVYDITLRGDTSSDAALLLGAIATNCVTDEGEVQHWFYCIARKGASVVVRHPQSVGHGRPISAELVVRRVPDPWSGAGRIVRQAERTTGRDKPLCDPITIAMMRAARGPASP